MYGRESLPDLMLSVSAHSCTPSAARGPKIAELRDGYAEFSDQFEAVTVNDIAIDQFPDALRGVDAVIHTASPLAGRGTPEEVLRVSHCQCRLL